MVCTPQLTESYCDDDGEAAAGGRLAHLLTLLVRISIGLTTYLRAVSYTHLTLPTKA